MKILKYRFAIHSANPDRLAKFYSEVLGFKETVKVDTPEEYGYGIEAAKGYKLWIARHSEIKEMSKDSFRILISFYVEDLEGYYQKVLKSYGAKIVEAPTTYCKGIVGEERKVCAFLDPDGNCVQMMEVGLV